MLHQCQLAKISEGHCIHCESTPSALSPGGSALSSAAQPSPSAAPPLFFFSSSPLPPPSKLSLHSSSATSDCSCS
ncbi:hypothetical protein Tsubulata_009849 [Turnera subulata]|uniref:Uncharacterized protein n=1 Tax=Turnera subulata TaxID=218843 RepID=A0A9Q0J907_9ROSI|nr:hypothetical protein Tsubulata_009849 [Turnera subulata]